MVTDTDTSSTDALAAELDVAIDQLLADAPPSSTPPAAFLGEQFDRGLAWVHWPEGQGGRGWAAPLQQRVVARLAEAGAPNPGFVNVIGYGMVAPTIATHGTPEQRARYLRPLFTCEEIWCQLFSEPGPAPTSPASPPGRCATATSGW